MAFNTISSIQSLYNKVSTTSTIVVPIAPTVLNSQFNGNVLAANDTFELTSTTRISNWICNTTSNNPSINVGSIATRYPSIGNLPDITYGYPGEVSNIYTLGYQHKQPYLITFTQTINFTTPGLFDISIWALPRATYYNSGQTVGITIDGTTVIADTSAGPTAEGTIRWKFLIGRYNCTTTGNKNIVIRCNSSVTADSSIQLAKLSLVAAPIVYNSLFDAQSVTANTTTTVSTFNTIPNWVCSKINGTGFTIQAIHGSLRGALADPVYGSPYASVTGPFFHLSIQQNTISSVTFTQTVNFPTTGIFNVSIWGNRRGTYYNASHGLAITIGGTIVIPETSVGISGATSTAGAGSDTGVNWKFLSGKYTCSTTGPQDIVIYCLQRVANDSMIKIAKFSMVQTNE